MILDGGATHSAASSDKGLVNLRKSKIPSIMDCHGNESKVVCEGDLCDTNGSSLKGYLVSDDLACNVTALCAMLQQFNGSVEFFIGAAYFNPANGGAPQKIAVQRPDGLYKLTSLPTKEHVAKVNLTQATQIRREKVTLLHLRWAHLGRTRMRLALSTQQVMGLRPKDVDLLEPCATCTAGKFTWDSKTYGSRSEIPGEVLCTDNTGRYRRATRNGSWYNNAIVDQCSNFGFTKGLKKITDSVTVMRDVVRREFKSVTKIVRTDRGPEWMNIEMDALMDEIGAKHQTAATGSMKKMVAPRSRFVISKVQCDAIWQDPA